MTRYLPIAILAAALAAPATAQEESETERGFDMLREGSRMILEGLMDEMRPMLEEARPFFEEEMMPFLESLGSLIDDLSAYEMPERLPNGDIIIRRLPDRPLPEPEPEVGEDGAVEL
ncbi:AAA+ family ATPase [Roseicyclus sp.]|uniref:AAA+ family ATPase n=1 Tax=Roseicyclus sp. TaxID=1914329 RepID=UPI003FA1839F